MAQKISVVFLIDKLAFGGTPLQVMELALHLDVQKFMRQFIVLAQIEPELQKALRKRGLLSNTDGKNTDIESGE